MKHAVQVLDGALSGLHFASSCQSLKGLARKHVCTWEVQGHCNFP